MSKSSYKRKRKEDQEAAAHVFKDFLETFQNPSISIANKPFVRSSVLYRNNEQQTADVGQIYNPKPLIPSAKLSETKTALECARILKDTALNKPKKFERPPSNLDLLKEELKQRHEKDKSPANSTEDAATTNLFVANLSSKITENHLMVEFGAYGPLASVKILWPRADETHRNSNCGFVAFMSRKDAERALKANQRRDDMRVCWGKSVEIPSHPIYIPDSLLKLYLPPPSSGLPFNAQPTARSSGDFARFLRDCRVKVAVPLNKKLLALVHRMIEFVVREGPAFEALVMRKELDNPDFNFLFDCKSPTHVYYRWKLFSILNGDGPRSWSMREFRMFEGGSVWCPPATPCYTSGMPDGLVEAGERRLGEAQSERLVELIRRLTMGRANVAEAMAFCLARSSAVDDAIEIIVESLRNEGTEAPKRIARLYLLSDVLSNCKAKKLPLRIEKQEGMLLEVFRFTRSRRDALKTLCDRDNFDTRIVRIVRHWDIYRMFSEEFLDKVNALFSGNKFVEEDDSSLGLDEPLDGACLLRRSSGEENGKKVAGLSEIDIKKYFVPSKWDAIDPDEVEAQAMSTEKMYFMEMEKRAKHDKKRKKKKSKR
ncbi:unnamed protein product [Phyllotreta striolata]|uniref:Uncharacterized protein n=1 Tax=Phyllotreta striolata TaxID=444603 RepID=A0A9N9TSW9_PHYSR|nr:unnamed protein product [Phyllotreta striolata]